MQITKNVVNLKIGEEYSGYDRIIKFIKFDDGYKPRTGVKCRVRAVRKMPSQIQQ